MRLIQLNTLPKPRDLIGMIILEDANGHAVWSVTYGVIRQRRERELYAEDGVYVQQLPDEHGVWRYRFDRTRAPNQPVTEALSDYVYIGPPIPPPAPEPVVCPTCGRAFHE